MTEPSKAPEMSASSISASPRNTPESAMMSSSAWRIDTSTVRNESGGSNTTVVLVTTFTSEGAEAVSGIPAVKLGTRSTSTVSGTMENPMAGTMEVSGGGTTTVNSPINITGNFSEADPFWKFQHEINLYAARLQALLQSGEPDADLLVYLPVFDNPADPRFTPVLQTIDSSGLTWEWVNDDLLSQAQWTPAGLTIGGMTFQSLVLPDIPVLPLLTAEKLAALAQAGVKSVAEVVGTARN